MRQTISGLVAAIAVVTASAAPALACGGGLFSGSCSPCGTAYVSPCAQTYVPAYTHSGCDTGCGGWWGYDRLADPVEQYHSGPVHHQYYYVNQGPTYTGPGAFAPYPTYEEADWGAYPHHPYYARRHHYGYGEHVLRRFY
jgi:hypothetical protein